MLKLSTQDLNDKRYTRDAVSEHNGVTHLTIQQQANGIDVFGATLNINIDKHGRILNVGGEYLPAARNGANGTTPVLSAAAAIAAAAESAGLATLTGSRSDGLVYFPISAQDLRLAWNVVVENHDAAVSYRAIVDANDGSILWRVNGIRQNHIDTHGLVYDGDNPMPENPIGSTDGSIVSRADRLFHGAGQEFPRQLGTPIFSDLDPHYDWWNGAARDVSVSNNVQAQEDRNGDDAGGDQATTGGDDFFDAPVDLTQEPVNYTAAAVTNLFYWVNRVHDIWYRYGFTEGFGNYQTDNLGLGGTGGDPVIADAQDDDDDGDGNCNANFNTNATEGNPGRMQMYQCDVKTPERDSDFSNSTIIHEYHHGLGERLRPTLHAGPCGPPGTQGSAIGEGGGDFQGILVLSEPTDDPNGSYGHSQYRASGPSGIRRSPYSIRPGVYPFTYGDIDDSIIGGSSECHDAGEIWANALWIARTLLVGRYGFVTGTHTIMQSQLDGYKLSMDTPDFLDMRDAILAADIANNDGANQCLLWSAFARMGMGNSASTTGNTDTTPVEAFDTPPACTPQISVNPSLLNFSLVPVTPIGGEDGVKSLNLNVCNVGNSDLFLTNVVLQSPNAAFTIVPPAPGGYPLPISHDFCHPIEVQCNPGAGGNTTATVQIESSDPDTPLLTPVTLSCTGAVPALQISPNPLAFGNVPVDNAGGQVDFNDLSLKVRNTGTSNLQVTAIAPFGGNAADFSLLPPVAGLPTIIAAGEEFDFQIRFNPSAAGARSTSLRVTSNAGTADVTANGTGVEPDIRVTGSDDFGQVCADVQAEKVISVCNTGLSNLVILSATVDCPDFTLINNPFPATVSHDFCAPLTVRFTPTSDGPKSCTLTITSNDPEMPSIDLTLTGETPATMLNVAPDQAFLPEVIQSTGACSSQLPFPISNAGQCKVEITEVMIDGENAGDFAVSGQPVLPTLLEPGHQLGEGDLNAVFAPTALDRDRLGTLSVTYLEDAITGDLATVTRDLCGEGVRTGARVLVRVAGMPLATVGKIHLQRITGNRNRPQVDSVDTSLNLSLQTVMPAAPCQQFQYHKEYGTIGNPSQLLPGSYQVTASAKVNGKRKNKTVAFDVTTCDFNPTVNVDF